MDESAETYITLLASVSALTQPAVASDLRDHSRNNDDPHDVAPAPADTTPEHHSPPSTRPLITTTLQP